MAWWFYFEQEIVGNGNCMEWVRSRSASLCTATSLPSGNECLTMVSVYPRFNSEFNDDLALGYYNRAGRVLRTLDLSEVAPSARIEIGYEAMTLLYETLARIELPPIEEFPGASVFGDTEGPAQWKIPHTDITIARVTEGTRKG